MAPSKREVLWVRLLGSVEVDNLRPVWHWAVLRRRFTDIEKPIPVLFGCMRYVVVCWMW